MILAQAFNTLRSRLFRSLFTLVRCSASKSTPMIIPEHENNNHRNYSSHRLSNVPFNMFLTLSFPARQSPHWERAVDETTQSYGPLASDRQTIHYYQLWQAVISWLTARKRLSDWNTLQHIQRERNVYLKTIGRLSLSSRASRVSISVWQ